VTDPLRQKKREGWLGLLLTAVLCLGFLYWWFRPARETWEPHSTAQLVARALAEPGLDDPQERLVLDFDLMETAILQARLAMIPEALETADHIKDPIVQARTIRQLAQAHLNQDAKRLGDALGMCQRINHPVLRDRMREEILLQLAMLGFSDVVLPEARTPLLRAKLARRLAETDGQDAARNLLTELESALPGLPAAESATLLPELAWTHVQLAITDGPQQAFAAIQRLPAAAQDELWLDLFRVCFGRGDTAATDSAAVAAQVTSPALRRQIELEAIQSNIPLRPVEEILAVLQQELKAAAPGTPQIRALIALADAHRRSTGAEAAAIPLRSALEAAGDLKDPVERATLLAELSELLPDALLFPESQQALKSAIEAARTVVAPDQRLPLYTLILRHAFNSGEIKTAADLATEALELAPKVKLAPEQLLELADFLTRLGDWPAALSLLPKAEKATSKESTPNTPTAIPELALDSPRAKLLDALATTAAEDAIGYDPADPPNRGEPMDRIRNRAITDEPAAASYLPGIPAGYQRARATLALAKGLLLPPMPTAGTNLPTDPTGPLDLLPGQSPDAPVMPPDPDAK
jgi:tetratricopeptide (TPR) repeat protein